MVNVFYRSLDSLFYSEPRFVTHIDDMAIRALTKYYSEVFPPSNSPDVCLLDLCSSWVSHSGHFSSKSFIILLRTFFIS